jgi:hypothetical protein
MLKIVLALHVVGGSAALLSMFIPMLTRKGGIAHRRAGWVFVAGMSVVSATAFILAGARFISDSRPAARAFAMFLFYIGILTAAGVSTGVRVLRVRRSRDARVPGQPGAAAGWWDLGISSVLVATAIGMMAFAMVSKTWLFGAFAAVGLVSGAGQLAYWLRPPTHRMHWWFEHMSSMLGSCIAATTAFLVVNAGRFGAANDSILVWLAPTIIGAPAIAAWQIYYRRKFATSPAARRDTRASK